MISLLKNDLKQLKNTVVIFSGFLTICFVLSLISFRVDVPIGMFYLIVLLYSLVIPIINLSYLFNQLKQTHFASLPYTKTQTFIVRYLSGLICLIVPIMVYCIIDAVIGQAIIINNFISIILVIWIYYSLGNLAAYLTTTVIMDIVLQIVINIAPIIIYFSLFLVYENFVRGIISADLSTKIISIIIPAYRLFMGSLEGLNLAYLLMYFGYGLVIFVMAFFACYHREYTNNYHGFTFKIISEIIKLTCIISVSWLFTAFLDIPVQSLKSFIIINVIATFVAVFIIQFIHSRRIRYVLCIAQGTLIVVMTIIILTSSKGYLENYIPHDIKAVEISSSFEYDKINTELSDPKLIDKIVKIHKDILKEKNEQGNYAFKITYHRANGDKVERGYYLSEQEYLSIIKKFDAALLKNWFDDYYYLNTKIDSYEYLTCTLAGETDFEIRSESDRLLFKNILQRKLADFENDPNLLAKVAYTNSGEIYVLSRATSGINSYSGVGINFNENDPMFLAVQEYHKIKAN